MDIYLIRHGQTKDNTNDLVQSDKSELDPNYTYTLKDIRKNLSLDGKVEIYSSPLERALQTTQIVFPDYTFNILSYAFEVKGAEVLIGKPITEHTQFWNSITDQDKYNPGWKPKGAENFDDVVKRVDKILEFLLRRTSFVDTLVLVTHGNFIRHLIGRKELGEKYSQAYFLDTLKPGMQIDFGGIIKLSM